MLEVLNLFLNKIIMRIRRFLLGKWRGTVTTAPIALSIIYNGSNQTLI